MPYETEDRKKPIFLRKRISFRNLGFIYTALQLPYEIGGSLDFDQKGRFLRFQLYPVNKLSNEIILPDSLSVEFHTHPSRRLVQMPSITDLIAQAKRSINDKKKFAKKYAQYKGSLAIVFNNYGAVVYSYKRKQVPTAEEKRQMLHILVAPRTDSIRSIARQAEAIAAFGYDINFQPWSKIKKSGLFLKFCSRRFHRVAT